MVPTFESHINSPLNHHGFDNPNEPAGTPNVVNLTAGLSLEFYRNSLLTLGFVTPVTGPRPFSYEALVLFNFRFGLERRAGDPSGDLGLIEVGGPPLSSARTWERLASLEELGRFLGVAWTGWWG